MVLKLVLFLLALMIGIAFCTLMIAFSAGGGAETGLAHPEIANMRIGGNGEVRFAPVSGYVLALQTIVTLLFGGLVYLGVSRHHRTWAVKISILIATAIALGVWFAIYMSYAAYLNTGSPGTAFGLPTATAWVVLGLWLSGFVFVLLYAIGFRSFIFSHDDEARYEALIAHHCRNDGPV
jgi:hypothetical protein